MTLNFEVHKPNLGDMQGYLKEQENKKDGGGNREDFITWWDFPAGMSALRVMPPWDPTGRVALPVYSHRIEFQGEGMKYKRYNWTCQNATFGKPCKICDGLNDISAAGVDTGDWGPWGKKFYFNALIMHDPIYHKMVVEQGKDPKDVPAVAPGTHVLVKAPKTVYDWIVAQITNPMIGDITDISNGIDIYVTKEGSGLGTKYTPTLSPNGRQPIPTEYLDKVKSLYNPDEIFGEGYEDELVVQLVDHLKRTSGVLAGGAVQATHAAMGGYTNPTGVPATPGAIPPMPGAMPPMPGAVTPPPVAPVAPPTPAPVAPPPVPAPQEHVDAQGNKYHLINNQWVLVESAQPIPQAPVAPPVPTAPPVAPAVPQAPMVNTAPPVGAPPSAPADASNDKPLCFGQHNPADINCVVCPHESACALLKQQG